MSVQKQRLKNVASLLLRDDENEVLFAMLGRGCLVRIRNRTKSKINTDGRLHFLVSRISFHILYFVNYKKKKKN